MTCKTSTTSTTTKCSHLQMVNLYCAVYIFCILSFLNFCSLFCSIYFCPGDIMEQLDDKYLKIRNFGQQGDSNFNKQILAVQILGLKIFIVGKYHFTSTVAVVLKEDHCYINNFKNRQKYISDGVSWISECREIFRDGGRKSSF